MQDGNNPHIFRVDRLSAATLKELGGGRKPNPAEVAAMVTELLTLREAEARDGTVWAWVEHPSWKVHRMKVLPSALQAGARVTISGRIFTVSKVLEPTEPGALPHIVFK